MTAIFSRGSKTSVGTGGLWCVSIRSDGCVLSCEVSSDFGCCCSVGG